MNVPRVIRRLFRAPFDGLKHFGVVEEGVLYRSGQPRPDELRRLIQERGLRTVISLRGSRSTDDPDGWEQGERAVCEEFGVHFVTLPCNHRNPPGPEHVEEFLRIVHSNQRRPALIHCRLGQQRTLLFCALYRVHAQGISPDEAEREMDALGFNIRNRRHQELLQAFRRLSRAASKTS